MGDIANIYIFLICLGVSCMNPVYAFSHFGPVIFLGIPSVSIDGDPPPPLQLHSVRTTVCSTALLKHALPLKAKEQ